MKTQNLDNYIARLITCGFSEDTARQTCFDFLRDFNYSDLEKFLKDMETVNDISRKSVYTK